MTTRREELYWKNMTPKRNKRKIQKKVYFEWMFLELNYNHGAAVVHFFLIVTEGNFSLRKTGQNKTFPEEMGKNLTSKHNRIIWFKPSSP